MWCCESGQITSQFVQSPGVKWCFRQKLQNYGTINAGSYGLYILESILEDVKLNASTDCFIFVCSGAVRDGNLEWHFVAKILLKRLFRWNNIHQYYLSDLIFLLYLHNGLSTYKLSPKRTLKREKLSLKLHKFGRCGYKHDVLLFQNKILVYIYNKYYKSYF